MIYSSKGQQSSRHQIAMPAPQLRPALLALVCVGLSLLLSTHVGTASKFTQRMASWRSATNGLYSLTSPDAELEFDITRVAYATAPYFDTTGSVKIVQYNNGSLTVTNSSGSIVLTAAVGVISEPCHPQARCVIFANNHFYDFGGTPTVINGLLPEQIATSPQGWFFLRNGKLTANNHNLLALPNPFPINGQFERVGISHQMTRVCALSSLARGGDGDIYCWGYDGGDYWPVSGGSWISFTDLGVQTPFRTFALGENRLCAVSAVNGAMGCFDNQNSGVLPSSGTDDYVGVAVAGSSVCAWTQAGATKCTDGDGAMSVSWPVESRAWRIYGEATKFQVVGCNPIYQDIDLTTCRVLGAAGCPDPDSKYILTDEATGDATCTMLGGNNARKSQSLGADAPVEPVYGDISRVHQTHDGRLVVVFSDGRVLSRATNAYRVTWNLPHALVSEPCDEHMCAIHNYEDGILQVVSPAEFSVILEEWTTQMSTVTSMGATPEAICGIIDGGSVAKCFGPSFPSLISFDAPSGLTFTKLTVFPDNGQLLLVALVSSGNLYTASFNDPSGGWLDTPTLFGSQASHFTGLSAYTLEGLKWCGLLSDGTIWCSFGGYIDYGHDWDDIRVSGNYVCAWKVAGTAQCWGTYSNGDPAVVPPEWADIGPVQRVITSPNFITGIFCDPEEPVSSEYDWQICGVPTGPPLEGTDWSVYVCGTAIEDWSCAPHITNPNTKWASSSLGSAIGRPLVPCFLPEAGARERIVFNANTCQCETACVDPWDRVPNSSGPCNVCRLRPADCEGLAIGSEFSASTCSCVPRSGGPTVPGITHGKSPQQLQSECLSRETDPMPVGSLTWLYDRGLGQRP